MIHETKRATIFTRRALLLMGGQATFLGLLATKLYQVHVDEGGRYATMAEENRISTRLMAPPRGRILDRAGTIIAGNRLNWRALLVTEQTASPTETLGHFARIVALLDHERVRIEREVVRHRRFVPIMIREFLSWEDMAKIEVNAPDLPGILVDVGTTRVYPFGQQLAHIAGYVAPPNERDVGEDPMFALPGIRVGRSGIERARDEDLRGRVGAVQLEVNAAGRVIRELDRREGQQGQDVTLTIDAGLQTAILKRLGDESASAVVLDCRNGEVMGMASNPSFDPALFNSGVSQAQWEDWTNNRRAPLINKAAAGLYSPGSTFKMSTALAGLDAKVITPSERVQCPGYFDFGDTRFHCHAKYGHGGMDMRNALKYSCDVYFYEVARRTGIDLIAVMSNRLGLGTDTGIDLPGARRGLIPTRAWSMERGRVWNIGDAIVSGIGQGYMQVTPLQLALYTARVASGRAVVPRLTRAVGGIAVPGGRAEDFPLLGLADRDLKIVRDGMLAAVHEAGGTAGIAKLPDGRTLMAGKTGSAQVRRVTREQRERGFNSETLPWEFRPHALFVAYAPFDQPRYALAVVVEHGNAGSVSAGPIARDIMAETLARDPARPDITPQRVAEQPVP
ncbi:MAG: penicillin-binding protein 2 [Acetobacteraceae bacterium]|nr:penicillin-binding protein 2 [Acetobacteraceae bacterium]